MENYEQKYKQALERASKLRVQNPFVTPDKETICQVVELYKQWCGEWTDQALSDYVQEHWQEEDTAEVASTAFTAMMGDPEQNLEDIINELKIIIKKLKS